MLSISGFAEKRLHAGSSNGFLEKIPLKRKTFKGLLVMDFPLNPSRGIFRKNPLGFTPRDKLENPLKTHIKKPFYFQSTKMHKPCPRLTILAKPLATDV
jgi:hypothetical protein